MRLTDGELTRRAVVVSAGVAGAVAMAAWRADSRSATRPNILIAVADDWSHPHAGAYGDPAVRTPAFDRVAAEGALFTQAFCAAPSCTPSRGALLTGQAAHRLDEGANLWSLLPAGLEVYPDLLERDAHYRVGARLKGWGPGDASNRPRNPAGPEFDSFSQFLDGQPAGKPFCFWLGSFDPHRPYDPAVGQQSGIDPATVVVPPYLPDTPTVRTDIVNYLAEVQRFDADVGAALQELDDRGLADNTLVVVTSDNGWPFPRGKANVYDAGTREPLAIRWPGRITPGTVTDRLTVLTDLAPTFLRAAGLPVPPDMTGQSLLPVFAGTAPARKYVVLERERHARARAPNLSYPMRALRTQRWLYIRNYFPARWPAGDPDFPAPYGPFSDIDDGPTKDELLANRDKPKFAKAFRLATALRPEEELYDVLADPYCLVNRAARPQLAQVKADLAAKLQAWMVSTEDRRATDPYTDYWDNTEYFGQ